MKTLQDISINNIRKLVTNNKLSYTELDNLTEICKNLVEKRIEKYDREILDCQMLEIIETITYYKSNNFPKKYLFKKKNFEVTSWNKKYIHKHQYIYNSQLSLYFN